MFKCRFFNRLSLHQPAAAQDCNGESEIDRRPVRTPVIVAGTLLAFACAAPVFGAHPVVPGFERFYHAAAGDSGASIAEGGRLLLGELNCLACHRQQEQPAAHAVQSKGGPVLDNVGSRVRPQALKMMLLDPQAAKPGTTMPHLLAGFPPQEREKHVDALVHFLASTGAIHDTPPDAVAVKRGEELYHSVGCLACHAPQRGETQPLATSVPLPNLAGKYTINSLAAFLANPLHVRPGGRMPQLNLTAQESRDIASYFLKDIDVPANVRYAYFEGNWQNLPNFDQLQPKATGQTTGIDVAVAPRKDNLGLVFEGYLPVDKAGDYRFFLGSDDGSRLLIDGQELIKVDGLHPYTEKNAQRNLTAGLHEVRVEFFQGGGDIELRVELQGPGLARQAVGPLLVASKDTSPQPGFEVNPALARQGQTLFGSLGCASCHQLKLQDKAIAAASQAPALSGLKTNVGCLATAESNTNASHNSPTPRYSLSERQQHALAAAIGELKSKTLPQLAEEESIEHTLVAFNCYACHTRAKKGGVEEARNAWFQGTTQEMGDEGRIPPALDGVGAKLTPDWFKHIFADGAKDRPYMHTRMPRFGLANVGHLAAAFAKLDGLAGGEAFEFTETPHRVKGFGRFMVGGQAFACIKCHTFGKYEATGIQSIDLTIMTRRLNKDWFVKYMLNPQAYRPGTRMPSAWPDGKSLLQNVLDGQPITQVNAVWEYLADADQARIPEGLLRSAIELKPYFQPRIYRNFIEGAGSRAIGVGYPERANLAFDADNLRLALIWHAGFIDAGRHWSGRGQGFQPPLGDHVIAFPNRVSFARLESMQTPWPEQSAKELGYRFRGYTLDAERRPAFKYDLKEGVAVSDQPLPVPGEFDPSLKRVIKISGSDPGEDNWYYRAAVGKKVERQQDGSWLIDGGLRVRITASGEAQAVQRTSDGQNELLVRFRLIDGSVEIVQEYEW